MYFLAMSRMEKSQLMVVMDNYSSNVLTHSSTKNVEKEKLIGPNINLHMSLMAIK